eukprot:gene15815-17410_t
MMSSSSSSLTIASSFKQNNDNSDTIECNAMEDNHPDNQRSSSHCDPAARTTSVIKSSTLGSMQAEEAKRQDLNDELHVSSEMPAPNEQSAKLPYGGRPLKYECKECKRRFHAPSHLKRHVMSHSSERPFHCQVCSKGFLQAWHLGRHMTTHTGNKPFQCLECPKSFGSRFEMKTHVNYIHRGIKEHQCEVCGKHFTLRSNLKVHMRKHTGEKPYKCNFCSKRFGQRGHLQYHIRKHEGKEKVQNDYTAGGNTNNIDGNASSPFRQANSPPVSDQVSDCHDDDVSMTSDRDSGIGSYDSEAESIATNSACSSPSIHDDMHHQNNDQLFSCEKSPAKRQPSPEFGLISMPHCFDRKVSLELPGRDEKTSGLSLKPYVCYSCNCGFAEVASLRAHVRHSHPRRGIASNDFRCAYCLKSYPHVDSLEAHVQNYHQQQQYTHYRDIHHQSIATRHYSLAAMNKKRAHSMISHPQKMSAKSMAFSIENLCADVVPKQKKTAQITHLHPAHPLANSTDPACFRPNHSAAPSIYHKASAPTKGIMHPASSLHFKRRSFYENPRAINPTCIY